jgi:hypothetical protein
MSLGAKRQSMSARRDTRMGQAEQRTDTAFTEGHLNADGLHIRYMEAGQGSPVVMLHGLGG